MSNSIDIKESEKMPKRTGPKTYAIIVICISSIPFLHSLYFMFFGNTGFLSEQELGTALSALFGGAILLTLLTLMIKEKYRIVAILLTTVALIPAILFAAVMIYGIHKSYLP